MLGWILAIVFGVGFLWMIYKYEDALADLKQAMEALRTRNARVYELERRLGEGKHRETPSKPKPLTADQLPEIYQGSGR